jgi:DNA-directed RNA polymerase subunit K/omega
MPGLTPRPTEKGRTVERSPKENRFEFVVIASARARQLLKGALPRETGEKKVTIAQREVLRRKVEKLQEEA